MQYTIFVPPLKIACSTLRQAMQFLKNSFISFFNLPSIFNFLPMCIKQLPGTIFQAHGYLISTCTSMQNTQFLYFSKVRLVASNKCFIFEIHRSLSVPPPKKKKHPKQINSFCLNFPSLRLPCEIINMFKVQYKLKYHLRNHSMGSQKIIIYNAMNHSDCIVNI